jgi:stearoyl-CoA desaturase (delta-9 desaturase)
MPWTGRLIPEALFVVVIYHVTALLALHPYFFSWPGVWLGVVTSLVFGAGIALGYHRLFAHQSFQCTQWVEYFFAIIGILSVQRGPAWWAATHRRHHRFSDSERDPHSSNAGFFWSHLGWFLYSNENTDPSKILEEYARDLMRNHFYAWVESSFNWFAIVLASWGVFFVAGYLYGLIGSASQLEALRLGMSFLIWGVFVRTVLVWHTTWLSASCSHRIGYRNFDTPDDSRNSWLLTLLLFGDGWANNHHAMPQNPRNTVKWWEFDVGWLIIKCLVWAGVARIPQPIINATRSPRT